MQRFEIEELVGLDLSSVEGVGQTSPVKLQGVKFDRRGGYAVSGMVQSGSASVLWGNHSQSDLIGYDQDGFAGVVDPGTPDRYRIIDGTTVTTSLSTLSSGAYSFINKVGLYHKVGAYDALASGFDPYPVFYVRKGDGTLVSQDDLIESSGSLRVTALSTSNDGGFGADIGSVLVTALATVPTSLGKFAFAGSTDAASVDPINGDQLNYEISASGVDSSASIEVFLYEQDTGALTYATTHDQAASISGTLFGPPPGVPRLDYPVAAAFSGHAVFHNRRVYGIPAGSFSRHLPVPRSSAPSSAGGTQSLFASFGNKTIIYSAFGYVNLVGVDSWFKVPFSTSDGITGLVSSPAGLLIFGEREAFLARSDPALDSFQLQRVSHSVGHDSDFPPAVLGGLVFTVFDGEVYAFALGMGDVDFGSSIEKVSQPFADVMNFERVISEANNRAIIAGDRVGSNWRAYRFDVDSKRWSNDPLYDETGLVFSKNWALPSDSSDGYILIPDHEDHSFKRPFGGGSSSDMVVRWEDVDLGDKNLKKLWRRVRVFLNDGFAGTAELNYSIGGSGGTISGTDLGKSRFVFTLPAGIVSEKADHLELTLSESIASTGLIMEPPVVIEAAPRYRQR